jgi:hypothetical protein
VVNPFPDADSPRRPLSKPPMEIWHVFLFIAALGLLAKIKRRRNPW